MELRTLSGLQDLGELINCIRGRQTLRKVSFRLGDLLDEAGQNDLDLLGMAFTDIPNLAEVELESDFEYTDRCPFSPDVVNAILGRQTNQLLAFRFNDIRFSINESRALADGIRASPNLNLLNMTDCLFADSDELIRLSLQGSSTLHPCLTWK